MTGNPPQQPELASIELRVPAEDADATREVGAALAKVLETGDLLLLSGGLGAGKTTFTQGIGQGLNVRGQVASPTFVIARVHPTLGDGPDLVHVDAYRLDSLDEVDALDLDASLEESVTVVEWGTGKVETLAPNRLEIEIVRPEGMGTLGSVTASVGGAEVTEGDGASEAGGVGITIDLEHLGDDAPREIVVRPVGPRWATKHAELARALGVA